MAHDDAATPVTLPASYTVEWALSLTEKLDAASQHGDPAALRAVLPVEVLIGLWQAATSLLAAEPTLLEVVPPPGATVTVVGDTHGQFHDVIHPLFDAAGHPSNTSMFVFNGDYVDRGSWGTELLAVLAAWKLALPSSVLLLRGNHESTTCTKMYGFSAELRGKYGAKTSQSLYRVCKKMFAALPLGAVIGGATLVVHGGVWRKPPRSGSSRATQKRRKAAKPVQMLGAVRGLEIGSLADIRNATKGGMDPSGMGASVVAADVLWSDPVLAPGLDLNDARGIGLKFGPDVTQHFLRANGLRLIVRSHEGPDARDPSARDPDDAMPPMLDGWTLDHKTPSGNLMTVFSAPDYPQFQASEERYRNRAAVLRLHEPDFATPTPIVYSALLPRPSAACFYDLGLPDSDEEVDEETLAAFAGSEISGLSGVSQTSEGAASVGTTAAQPSRSGSHGEVVSQQQPRGDNSSSAVSEGESVQLCKRRRVDENGSASTTAPGGGRCPQHSGPGSASQPVSPGQEGSAEAGQQPGMAANSAPTDAAISAVSAPSVGLALFKGGFATELSKPDCPEALDVGRTAASGGVSDARDSLAGALLAGLAVDAPTPQSEHTPLPGAPEGSPLQLDSLLRHSSRFVPAEDSSPKPRAPATAAQNGEETTCREGDDVATQALDGALEDRAEHAAVPGESPAEGSAMLHTENASAVRAGAPSAISNGSAGAPASGSEEAAPEMRAARMPEKPRREAFERQHNGSAAPGASKKPVVKPWK